VDRICNRVVNSSRIDSVVSMKKKTILERLATIETQLSNHLHSHDRFIKFGLYPIFVGLGLLILKALYDLVILGA